MSGPSARPRRPGSGSRRWTTGSPPAEDVPAVQAICDSLGPTQIDALLRKWLRDPARPVHARRRRGGRLPVRAVGPAGRVLADPDARPPGVRGIFFEQVLHDNLDIGRPDQIELIFARRIRSVRAAPSPGRRCSSTGVITRGVVRPVQRRLQALQHQAVPQDGPALRIETIINDTHDLGCQRRLTNLPELQTKARAANRRLLDTERVGQGCVLASPAFERIAHPTTSVDGRRAPALRFGDPRVQALAGALCVSRHAVTASSCAASAGVRSGNRSVRAPS